MSDRLKQFIEEHREAFEEAVPLENTWDKIEGSLPSPKKQRSQKLSLPISKWAIAAAILALVTGGLWFFIKEQAANPIKQDQSVAVNPSDTINKKNNLQIVGNQPDTISKQEGIAETKNSKQFPKKQDVEPSPKDDMKEEMFHYAKLIEIKQRELKSIEREEPLLYKQFSGDLNKLDTVYHSLENQLQANHNSEELLEAMIQNLQLQMGLLNQQLGIIKKINHKKKSAYEKAYQSI